MSLVTVDDVQVRLGRALTAPEQQQVAAWLGDLEAMAEARISGFAAAVVRGETPMEMVRAIFAQAIRRVLLNPAGLRQESRTIDDYTESRTFDSSVSGSVLGFTEEEWAQLSPAAATGAFTIRPAGAPDHAEREWTMSTSWRWPV